MSLQTISGNILHAKEQYICHSCNCISTGAAGLAKLIFENYPYSNSYINRKVPNIPGTITIHGDGINKRYIINMYTQYFPGKPQKSNKDNEIIRQEYFKSALNCLSKIKNIKSIAFPYNISCGLAGGDWQIYSNLINEFCNNNNNIDVVIYKL